MIDRLVSVPADYDLRGSLASLMKSGMSPPIARWVDSALHKATSTPSGPASVRFERTAEGVEVKAWGPGADWVLANAERWLGLHDDPSAFEPLHPMLAEQHRRRRGVHMGHTHRVFDALFYVILGQKVTEQGARGSRQSLWRQYAETAPGPVELLLPIAPSVLKELGTFHFHPHNVEAKRAATILECARRAKRLEETVHMDLPDAHARLHAVRGLGPWTIGIVAAVALGDPDAVQVGDYHLKNTVAWHLAGEDRATDERMLELLQPWSGQRRRAVAYLGLSGAAPRYGPRLGVNDIRGR
ncbi:MAG: DNA-3-methyladenine glycosylase 2 family protein [Alphaproteobacteria bacterium]|nr:DNA-3-methyladenine glycosylase 2 family protein [Alphaproteobacteria bacterium]